MQTIICMKWGDRYGAHYVNRLYAAVCKYTARPTRFICFCDDKTGLHEAIETADLPFIDLPADKITTPWRKLSVWQSPLIGPQGESLRGDVLFLDLDMVVTGFLDVFFEHEKGRFCVIENWTQKGKKIGNTSAFRFCVGAHAYIYDEMSKRQKQILNTYRIEQVYISREISDMVFWPSAWCKSFKHDLLPAWPFNFIKNSVLPQGTRLVAFTGKPDPDEALRGHWPVRHPLKSLYKYTRPALWIEPYWDILPKLTHEER